MMVPIVPMVSIDGSDAWERSAEQPRVLVSGSLDRDNVAELSAKLMAFDSPSSCDVEMVVNSTGGSMGEVFAVLDVLDLMRAKVHATVIGSAAGTAVAIVAHATGERRAAQNAVFTLRVHGARHRGAQRTRSHAPSTSKRFDRATSPHWRPRPVSMPRS